MITHEEIIKDRLVIRCLGRLDGYAIYEAENEFSPGDRGVTIRRSEISKEIWEKTIKELRARGDRKHLPRNVFLGKWQIETLLFWADGLFGSLSETKPSCEDCKGTGWYVGVVERYPCPTCQGTKA